MKNCFDHPYSENLQSKYTKRLPLNKHTEYVIKKNLVQQINTFLESHNTLLDPLQSGYKRYHSTITALLRLTADLTEGLNKSNFECSVFHGPYCQIV